MLEFGAMMPDPRMQGLVEIFTANSVMLKLLKFVESDTLAYRYNRDAALPGIDFRAVNGVYPSQSYGITNPEVETLAIFGGPVITDTQLANPKVRSTKVAKKLQNAGLVFDYVCFWGNPSVNANQFNGLVARVGGSQVISAGTNGGAMVVDAVVATQDQTVGTDNSKKPLLMSKQSRRYLSSTVRAEARGMGVFDASGKQLVMFNDSPIVVFDELATPQPPIPNNENWGTATNATSIWCMSFGGDVDEENLQGIVKMNPVGPEKSPVGMGPDAVAATGSPISYKNVGDFGEYYKDLVEAAMTIAPFHPRCVTRYAGLIAPETNPY